jgi:hypothetical protein
VRLVRFAYQVDEVRFVSRLLVYEVRLSALWHAQHPEPTKLTHQEAVS